ncbi:hypothetical protein BGZ52_006129 [Haplosporangium bisporale]|nr:hypothetical protein BGZ52_006129 [Haplosporangium bisporale]
MGRDLYEAYAAAREVVDEADDALAGTLKHVMFEGSQEELTRTENAQPAILTTSIAMLRVLETERGFDLKTSCKFALGHSLGEYSALVATKSLSLKDAVKLVRLRGEAMTKAVTNKGTTAMSALVVRALKLEDLTKAMDEIKSSLPAGEIAEIANINSPAADAMKEALKDIQFEKPIIDVVSNVTAQPIKNANDISDLLVRQVTGTVQWHQSIGNLQTIEQVHNYISLGPGKVLANLLRKEYPRDFVKTVTSVEDIQLWKL